MIMEQMQFVCSVAFYIGNRWTGLAVAYLLLRLFHADYDKLIPWNWSLSWETAGHSDTQKISQNFKEAEGSLLRSQEPSIASYPEPDKSSPYHSILFP
jgi:hypothetical protein